MQAISISILAQVHTLLASVALFSGPLCPGTEFWSPACREDMARLEHVCVLS